MGTLLLLAALLTWSIGLMMSPHGETVAKGTDYLRTTIVIFKRNGAIGTLVLCALAAWLLFPARRPKWPARDWTLVAVFAFLAGSSLYTLIWLEMTVPHTADVEDNFATADPNATSNAIGDASDMNAVDVSSGPPAAQFQVPAQIAASGANGRSSSHGMRRASQVDAAREPPDRADVPQPGNEVDPANNQANENQD